jgi:hypothetical protein
MMGFRGIALALMVTTAPHVVWAGPKSVYGKSGPLYDTIARQDKIFFGAFNRCDLKTLAAHYDDNAEFYHDMGGVTLGKAAFLKSVKENVCGKFTRELVPGSLEVYPVPNYGALEIGTHRFLHADPGEPTGEGRFAQLWKNSGGHWKMTRIFSYDHGQASH